MREVSDVVLRWVFYRLYGGSPPLAASLLEVVPQLLGILAKRNLIVSENDVMMVVSILREFSLSGVDSRQLPESVQATIKTLVRLRSGDTVLKVILKQYQQDLTAIHKHLRKENMASYR